MFLVLIHELKNTSTKKQKNKFFIKKYRVANKFLFNNIKDNHRLRQAFIVIKQFNI